MNTAGRHEKGVTIGRRARNLGPAELLEYDKRRLRGVVLEEGSLTAHVVIVARAMGIPVLGRVQGIRHKVRDGDILRLDAVAGTLQALVDERAALANSIAPNAVVSIHGDGGPATGRGFHILYSSPPLNTAQAGPSVQFARVMRDQLAGSGIPPATYIGNSGLNPRSDIAGLNLAQYPSILVELGNMKNPLDSTLMGSDEGRQKYADAVVKGIVAFLQTQPPRTS